MKLQSLIIRCVGSVFVVGVIWLFLLIPNFLNSFQSKKSINVLVSPNIFDAQFVQDFEKETDIKVYVTFFETYEELIVKMRSGGGDYDLIMGVDYNVDIFKDEKLVKPLDKTKLDFIDMIYPSLTHLYCDPGMQYGLPFAWEMFSIGINSAAFKDGLPEPSWDLLFDKKYAPYRVAMLEDTREAIYLAVFYLFGDRKNLTAADLEKVLKLLREQKEWITLYTDFRSDYLLLSGTCSIAVGLSSDIQRAVLDNSAIKLMQPKEGIFAGVDMFMISAGTKKDEYVYQFLNYVYSPKVYKEYLERYNFMPARSGIVPLDDPFYREPTQELFKHIHFFNHSISEAALHTLWITLKS